MFTFIPAKAAVFDMAGAPLDGPMLFETETARPARRFKRASALAGCSPQETARIRRACHRDAGRDYLEMSLGGLIMTAVLLFAAGLMRFSYGLDLGYAASAVDALALAMGGVTCGAFIRGLVHLRQAKR